MGATSAISLETQLSVVVMFNTVQILLIFLLKDSVDFDKDRQSIF